MSGLAEYLLEQGCEVSGSDICGSKYTHKLEKSGVKVFIGHKAENVPGDCTVVASTAIREDNPELLRAEELGLKILHRSDLLAQIANNSGKFFLGYCGMHGKTTTSGLASYVLAKAGYEPSYVVGGFVPELNSNAQCANGGYFVAELDESDGTLVKYKPNLAVINNIEPDHLDFFTGGLEDILKNFSRFLDGSDAVVIANNDCENTRTLIQRRKTVTFGLNDADYTAKNIEYNADFTTFDVYYKGEFLADLKIILKGEYNVYNALAVFASLCEAGGPVLGKALGCYFAEFTGMGRRFEKVAEFGGIVVYDDYAHHPTEIKAALSAAKSFKDRNVVAVFQPHRYTRFQKLWNEFADSFGNAGRVVVTDIYSASEEPVEGVSSEKFAVELSKRLNVQAEHMSGDMRELARKLLPTLKSGDIVIGMGAGTITCLGRELQEAVVASGI